jgi:methionine-rich copper-binding protein CopC
MTMYAKTKMWRVRPMAWALAIVMMLLFAGGASAHGVEVTNSDPAAGAALDRSPTQVRAWFNEELQSGVSTMVVLDAKGKHVDTGDGGVDLDDPDHASMVASLPSLPDGVYTVSWYVVLLDGDPSQGEFSFSVGKGSVAQAVAVGGAPAAAEVAPAAAPEPGTTEGLPLAWIALGFGLVVVLVVLATLLLRSRSVGRA